MTPKLRRFKECRSGALKSKLILNINPSMLFTFFWSKLARCRNKLVNNVNKLIELIGYFLVVPIARIR